MSRKWVSKYEGEEPFTGTNIIMTAISAKIGAEGIGVSHYEESFVEISNCNITNPELMIKYNNIGE